MAGSNQNLISVDLPSLVRRTQHTQTFKGECRKTGAILSRKGRSRNWQLALTANQLQQLVEVIYRTQEPSWHWIAKRLEQHRPKSTADQLLALITERPSITVSELQNATDCTLAEARLAIERFELA